MKGPFRRRALLRRARQIAEVVTTGPRLRDPWLDRTGATVVPAGNDNLPEEYWCVVFDAIREADGADWFACDADAAGIDAGDVYELRGANGCLEISWELAAHHILIFDADARRAVLATMDDYALIAGDGDFIDGVFGSFERGVQEFDGFLDEYDEMFQESKLHDKVLPYLRAVRALARKGTT